MNPSETSTRVLLYIIPNSFQQWFSHQPLRIYYCLLIMGLLIYTSIITFLTANDSVTYVPKSRRWNRYRRMKAGLHHNISVFGKTIESYVNTWRTKPRTVIRSSRTRNDHHKFRHWRKDWKTIALVATVAITMQAQDTKASERHARFDTDSGPLGIDNRCSACISHVAEDFEGPLRDTNRMIKGFGGSRTGNIKFGTIVWHWEDNNGLRHKFVIPNSIYSPSGKTRLLSPQHWAQEMVSAYKGKAKCSTTDDKSTLTWNNGQNKLFVPVSPINNVCTFPLAPGYNKFDLFCQSANYSAIDEENNPITISNAQLISDDDEDNDSFPSHNTTIPDERNLTDWSTPAPTTFDLDGPSPSSPISPPVLIDDEEDVQTTNTAKEMLRLHHTFGHCSFRKLQQMATIGILPSRLRKCPIPVCSACEYAKATKRKWRDKPSLRNHSKFPPTRPGQIVSIDQMVSPVPGLVAQLTSRLTKARYKYATVFVDQYSKVGYVHLQKTATAEETIEAKTAFEQYAKSNSITVQAYHADNGIFRANLWRQACSSSGQALSFAGVNAHHQNGIAERRIRTLQDSTRTMLMHSKHRWNDAIDTHLWPFALKEANAINNDTPLLHRRDSKSATHLFTGLEVHIQSKHQHPFGCPIYVLDSKLQEDKPFGKWKQRSRMGVYLGKPP